MKKDRVDVRTDSPMKSSNSLPTDFADTDREIQRMTRLHELEVQHQKSTHETFLINRDEEARRLKVQSLLLRDENAEVAETLYKKDAQISALTRQRDQLRLEVDNGMQSSLAQGMRLKKQDTDIANLRAEVSSLNSCMQDSGKALQEKFALSRELNRIRPELEHLQSQLANYKVILAERNDLRRQVDTLEVELENEKRSRQRQLSKEDDGSTAEMRSRLLNAENRLTSEAAERNQMRKQHEKEVAEARSHNERLEERLGALRDKFKKSQADLKETRMQLEACQSELSARNAGSRGNDGRAKKSISVTANSLPGRRRRGAASGLDVVPSQTSDGGREVTSQRTAIGRATEGAAVGEKSTFSITPFLNRTKSLSDENIERDMTSPSVKKDSENKSIQSQENPSDAITEDPPPQSEAQENAMKGLGNRPDIDSTSVPTATVPKRRGRPRTKTLAEAPPSETNKIATRMGSGAESSATRCDAVEEAGGQVAPDETQQKEAAGEASFKGPEAEVKMKKKRKLLGTGNQVLLDGENVGETAGPKKAAWPVLAPTKRAKIQLGGNVASGFAKSSFSPLKRERRGVNASFLA